MTKQEYRYKVKEMLNMCLDPTSDCSDCDYHDYNCCQDYLCRDALFVIEDLELELKQVQIDALNKVKNCREATDSDCYTYLERIVNKAIKEVQNENT